MRKKIKCVTCKIEFECRKYQYRNDGERYLPRFCSMECRKFENFSYEQKIEVIRKSYEKDVVRKEGCWDWKGTNHEDGYAKLSISYKIGIQSGHGASYMIHKGKIPQGMVVRHKCFNRVCTNPDHLEIGTPKENIRDTVDAGRGARGNKNNKAKLTDENVLEIRETLKNIVFGEKISKYKELAKKYCVNFNTIQEINNRRAWKHLSP